MERGGGDGGKGEGRGHAVVRRGRRIVASSRGHGNHRPPAATAPGFGIQFGKILVLIESNEFRSILVGF